MLKCLFSHMKDTLSRESVDSSLYYVDSFFSCADEAKGTRSIEETGIKLNPPSISNIFEYKIY
jgi:hypothetical protein